MFLKSGGLKKLIILAKKILILENTASSSGLRLLKKLYNIFDSYTITEATIDTVFISKKSLGGFCNSTNFAAIM